jgi:lipopolysaccharide transport system permease protein
MNMTMRPRPGQVEGEAFRSGAAPEKSVVIGAARTWGALFSMAAADLRDTFKLWPLVWTLAVLDIRLRYRGSILGPFWLTLSTAVMVGAMGFIYSRLFHTNTATYLPFLSLSLVLWNFINTLTTEGCTCFTMSESVIRAMRMPLSLHAARVVVRNILVLGHNIVVIAVVFIVMKKVPGPMSAAIVPAFMLWLVDAIAVSILLGAFCARFRDVPPIVASLMQIVFFISPILWSPAVLAHRGIGVYLINWNPFYALLEIVRGPLLGTHMALQTWGVALGYSALLFCISTVTFALARARIAYWV